MEPLHFEIDNFDENILTIYKKIASKIFSRKDKTQFNKLSKVKEYENSLENLTLSD
jgi:hypothetical protein